jgi:hypothetical protein
VFFKPIHQLIGSTLSREVFEIETSETFFLVSTLSHENKAIIDNEKKMLLMSFIISVLNSY